MSQEEGIIKKDWFSVQFRVVDIETIDHWVSQWDSQERSLRNAKKCEGIHLTTPELFIHERSFQMADNESMMHAKLNHFVGLFAPLKSGN